MACTESYCLICKHEWSDTMKNNVCPRCGSRNVQRLWDEQLSEMKANEPPHFDREFMAEPWNEDEQTKEE